MAAATNSCFEVIYIHGAGGMFVESFYSQRRLLVCIEKNSLYLYYKHVHVHTICCCSIFAPTPRPPPAPQGSYDSEGCPIVVFTVARHDMKSSDLKASMQLLFYTLDQLAET